MMALPFVLCAAATACALAGLRAAAVSVWAVGIVGTLVLFRLHATDALALGF